MEKQERTIKENRESVKKYIDKANAFIYADKENISLLGTEPQLLTLLTLLLRHCKEKFGKDSIEQVMELTLMTDKELDKKAMEISKEMFFKIFGD